MQMWDVKMYIDVLSQLLCKQDPKPRRSREKCRCPISTWTAYRSPTVLCIPLTLGHLNTGSQIMLLLNGAKVWTCQGKASVPNHVVQCLLKAGCSWHPTLALTLHYHNLKAVKISPPIPTPVASSAHLRCQFFWDLRLLVAAAMVAVVVLVLIAVVGCCDCCNFAWSVALAEKAKNVRSNYQVDCVFDYPHGILKSFFSTAKSSRAEAERLRSRKRNLTIAPTPPTSTQPACPLVPNLERV